MQLIARSTALFIMLLLVTGGAAHAAQPSDALRNLQRQQEQIILQQQERLRMQEREFRDSGKEPSSSLQPGLFPRVEGKADEPCMEVRRIHVSGATLLSSSALASLISPYQGRCLSLADINNLLRDITNAYIERGYVTARAFVDPADNSPGALQVLVIEGVVEKIIINDGDKNSYYRGKTAFPFLEGKPLNLRDIEQGLDQLNRLPSADASMELEPGSTLGGTVIRVRNATVRSWRAGAGFDNYGQRSTGQGMYSLSLEKDNAMGIGDQFAVYWSQDMPAWDEDVRSRDRQGSNSSLSAFFSLPFGYWTFSGSLSRSRYSTYIDGMNTRYTASGVTDTANVRAERVIHRDADGKTSFFAGLTHRNVDNYIEGVRLVLSSYNLTTMELGFSHNRRLLGGIVGASAAYSRGLHAFGATKSEDGSHFTPQSQFDKYSLMVTYYRPFALKEQHMYWNMSAYGQFSDRTLYGPERIQIGGRSSVRGFHEDSIAGDKGFYVRNELGWNLPWFDEWRSTGPVNGIQLYGAYDFGLLHPDSFDRYERGRMQGLAVGLRTLGDLSFEASAAKAIDHPAFVKTRDMEFYISARYTF